MKHLLFSLVLASAATLTGCASLVSLNPIVTDDQAVMDTALLGVWTSSDGKDTCSVRQDGTAYKIRYLSDSSDTYQFKARLMVAGEVKLLDLVSANEDAFQLSVHTPLRVWTEGSTVRVAFPQTSWLKEQALGNLTVAQTKDRTLMTAESDAISAFLVKSVADPRAYEEAEAFHRVQ